MNDNLPNEHGTVFPLFPIPFYHGQVQLTQQEKSCVIDKLKYYPNQDQGSFLSNDRHLHKHDNQQLKSIFGKVQSRIDQYVFDHLKLNRDEVSCSIAASWALSVPPQARVRKHMHAGSLISGVLYLQTDDNSGGFIMESSRGELFGSFFVPNYVEHNIWNTASHTIYPNEGDLFLFPSDVYHKIEQNQSDITRYSIAFDVVLEGKFFHSMHDNIVEIKRHKY